MTRPTMAVAVALVLVCGLARADVVVLKNGDRISGKIETLGDGKLKMKTDAMAEVTIAMANVQTFSTDEPILVKFKNGTIIHEKINASDVGRIAIAEGGVLAPQTFDLAAVTDVNPPEKPKVTWKGHVTGSYVLTTGNSRTQNGSLDASFMRRGEDDRITVNAIYLYGWEKDKAGVETTTRDKWRLDGKYDYFFSKKTYMFVDASYEKDRIAHLVARAIADLGVGHQWIESKKMNFNTDLGLGGMHEEYSSPTTTNNTIVGQAGYHFDWALTKTLTLIHDLRYTPDLEQFSNYKILTSGELRAALTKSIFASFKIAVDYNSQPPPGIKSTDIAYILGVGVNF